MFNVQRPMNRSQIPAVKHPKRWALVTLAVVLAIPFIVLLAVFVPQRHRNTPPVLAECKFCKVPPGYLSETIPAPVNATAGFSPRWQTAHTKAATFLSNWTLEEKVMLVTGSGWMTDRCVGNTPPVPAHNWTGLCLQDSPLGIRFADRVSAFPAGINVASTFDKKLMYNRGKAMGEEFRDKGVHVALSPMTNIMRTPNGGRSWEGFGGDPYLAGWATYETVRGLQKVGVQATVKHFVAQEQERDRTTSSSNLDDRTMREVYSHPFLRAVQADVASVMCSYNLINGSWACQNSKTLNGILKTDFGFGGYVMSDWDAQHSGVQSAINGLDMTMPGDIGMDKGKTSYWGKNLVQAVTNGSVSMDRLDDMAHRIIAAWHLVGQDKGHPAVNFDSWNRGGANNSHIDVQGHHDVLIRDIGAASTVLLKNINHTLPLKKPLSMALIGSDLAPSSRGPNFFNDRIGYSGTLAMAWGSGTAEFPYLIDPFQAISQRARKDRTNIDWWFQDWEVAGAAEAANYTDMAIVGISADSGEAYGTFDGNAGDRKNISAWNNGDELVKAVAAVNNNTIVVVHSVGPIDMESWIEHPNVTAVLWAGLPGQESGNALVDVLYGHRNPSGRLPYTIARKTSDYAAAIGDPGGPEPNVDYKEGLNIDYRHFLAQNITPRFPFGFGLSYTNFSYSHIVINHLDSNSSSLDMNATSADSNVTERDDLQLVFANNSEGTPVGRFMTAALHVPRWNITVEVTNNGSVTGHDAPQLYLSFPASADEPVRVLRDFDRVKVKPNETETVAFNVSRYDVSIWDTVQQDWVVPNGTFTAIIAKHAMDTGLQTTFCPGQCSP